MDEKSLETLKRRAYGYTVTETVTEYDSEGNEVKQKLTTKQVQPDLAALKMLIELGGEEDVSEEELIKERERIMKLLAKMYSTSAKEQKKTVNSSDDLD